MVFKHVYFKVFFQNEGHFYANVLIFILTVYRKCLLLQFFRRGVRMHVVILTEVQNGNISLQKKLS